MNSKALEIQDTPSSSGFRVFMGSREVATVILRIVIIVYSTSTNNTNNLTSIAKSNNIGLITTIVLVVTCPSASEFSVNVSNCCSGEPRTVHPCGTCGFLQ